MKLPPLEKTFILIKCYANFLIIGVKPTQTEKRCAKKCRKRLTQRNDWQHGQVVKKILTLNHITMETTTIQAALTMYQQNELLPQAEQWQKQGTNVVAVMADGRKIRQVDENRCEVSLYKGNPANDAQIGEEIGRLRRNYTQMKPDFFAELANELMADRWPAERIKDAVTHVLRAKPGGFISIADIFTFDKPMKLYNYSGYCWLINNNRAQDNDCCGEQSDFGKITVEGKVFFYLKKDLPIKK